MSNSDSRLINKPNRAPFLSANQKWWQRTAFALESVQVDFRSSQSLQEARHACLPDSSKIRFQLAMQAQPYKNARETGQDLHTALGTLLALLPQNDFNAGLAARECGP